MLNWTHRTVARELCLSSGTCIVHMSGSVWYAILPNATWSDVSSWHMSGSVWYAILPNATWSDVSSWHRHIAVSRFLRSFSMYSIYILHVYDKEFHFTLYAVKLAINHLFATLRFIPPSLVASCRPRWTDFGQDKVNVLLICTND